MSFATHLDRGAFLEIDAIRPTGGGCPEGTYHGRSPSHHPERRLMSSRGSNVSSLA